MKIAQVITRSDTLGGASAHVRDLTKALVSQGHEVCVFIGGNGPIVELFNENDIQVKSIKNLVRELSPVNDIKAYFELKALLAEYSPDLVACHSAKAGLLGRLAASKLKLPVVYTAHGWPFTHGVPNLRATVYRHIEKFMSMFCDKIITVSQYDKDLARHYEVADEDKLHVIWNGVPNAFPSSTEELNKYIEGLPTILMLARFEQPKNFSLLLSALSKIEDIGWKAKLVGDGPDLEQVKAYCEELSLREKVDFLGWRNDIPNLLAEADIFALISDWEGLPLSVLEAMRAGLPIIASDVGGVKEAVEHNKTGFLVSNKHPDDISKTFRKLLSDSTLRKSMGSCGRERFNTYFCVEKMAEKTLDVYIDAVSNNKSTSF